VPCTHLVAIKHAACCMPHQCAEQCVHAVRRIRVLVVVAVCCTALQIYASVVSTLLALMDGLADRGNVVVIAATNRCTLPAIVKHAVSLKHCTTAA
jgi:hypothetical protein